MKKEETTLDKWKDYQLTEYFKTMPHFPQFLTRQPSAFNNAMDNQELIASYLEFLIEIGMSQKEVIEIVNKFIKETYEFLTGEDLKNVIIEVMNILWIDGWLKERFDELWGDEFNLWFESIKDLVASIDPNGGMLLEIVDGRYSVMINEHFKSLTDRFDFIESNMGGKGVNVEWFGGKGDNKTINDTAIKKSVALLKARNWNILYFPKGVYLVDYVTKFENMDIHIRGENKNTTIIKVKEQSKLMHADRDYSSNQNTNLDKLFRDYFSVFFFMNCDFSVENIQLDGNPENNFHIINNEKYNYYAETIHSQLGITGYRYYHGIDVLMTDSKEHVIDVRNCIVRGFPWNNIAINNQGVKTKVKMRLVDNFIESSAQDGVSIHKIYGDIIVNNRVKNANSHSTHVYHSVDDIQVINEEYIFTEEDYFNFLPNVRTALRKHGLQVGHGSYVDNILRNIFVDGCYTTLSDDISYEVCGLFLGKTIENIEIKNCDFSNCQYPIMIYPLVMGKFVIDNCKLNNYKLAGVLFNIEGLQSSNLHPKFTPPYSMNLELKNCEIVSKKADTNAIRFTLLNNAGDDKLGVATIVQTDNYISSTTFSQSPKINVIDNNHHQDNLLDFSYDVIDGVAQGWRGRNSTNKYTEYISQNMVIQDVGGEFTPVQFLKINSSGNPDVTFDNLTYTNRIHLTNGSYTFRFIARAVTDVTIRLELRDSSGRLLTTLLPETKMNLKENLRMYVFYFDIPTSITSFDQIFTWFINSNDSMKINDLFITGVKLERTNKLLPYLTKLNVKPSGLYSINTPPPRVGLITFGGKKAYISVGSDSVNDWIEITNKEV